MLCEFVADTTIYIKVIETQRTLGSLNKRRMIQFYPSFQQWAMLPLIADPLKELDAVTWFELVNHNFLANFITLSCALSQRFTKLCRFNNWQLVHQNITYVTNILSIIQLFRWYTLFQLNYRSLFRSSNHLPSFYWIFAVI